MALINIQNVNLAFGGPVIFNGINLSIEQGEKVSLTGRNGIGKSTLLKLISGSISQDSGSISIQKGIRVAFLLQEVPQDIEGSVFDVIAGGLQSHFDLVRRYHTIGNKLSKENSPTLLEKLNRVHDSLDRVNGWEMKQQVDKIISQFGFDPDFTFNSLSVGLKRQVLLGKTLAGQPHILLLDEPTNHMDIDSIKRLEDFLIRFSGTLVFVTHDRTFLRKVANRIVEIDRGRLFSQNCNYDTFLVRKQALLDAEEAENRLFDKKLVKEEQWIRQGIKARRTRNEGRVRELKKMREIRKSRRQRSGLVNMQLQEGGRSGKIVTEAEQINFAYGEKVVISNFSTTILKGDRVGIIGPNGIGKTTLLSILLGKLKPLAGKVRIGTGIQLTYFDQLREQLDETKNVRENVGDGQDILTINGNNRHIIGYLKDFLFSPEQALAPISMLSGGERNRLLLARLFTRPSNLLVLDEPTNDLDAETLELLEELLMQYKGTILLISHDRSFINNIVTSTIIFEKQGVVKEYIGGYDDWIRQRPAEVIKKKTATKIKQQTVDPQKKGRKLGYMEKRELNSLPEKIEKLEAQQEELFQVMNNPDFYKQPKLEIVKISEKVKSLKEVLNKAYKRWEELEE